MAASIRLLVGLGGISLDGSGMGGGEGRRVAAWVMDFGWRIPSSRELVDAGVGVGA